MTRNRVSIALAAALVMVTAASRPAFPQAAGGTVSGTITDPSQAVVPDAEVVILHRGTGQRRTLTTNARGFFSAPNLSPGRYDVTVTAPGFATAVQKNVLIEVGQEVVANIQLRVGNVEASVEVEGAAPGVALASATLSNVVGGQTVRDLPINGRDWTLLAALEPGVHTIEAQSPITMGGNARANRGWGAQMTIGGNRPQQNNYRLDGISINDYSGGGPGGVLGSVLGVDAIQEFSVVTGNASAEYGKTSGGVINAVTRAGQNELRGSAYEFFRHSSLDARNYFDGPEKPRFKRHQFGASLGGPLVKNRTFFFFDYEGLRQDLGITNINTVPSRAARAGQLTTGRVTVDPKVVPFLGIYPEPNGSENGDFGLFSFVSEASTREDLVTGRVDHRFSDANNLHATFMTDTSQTLGPDGFNFLTIGQKSRRQLAVVEDTHILGRSVVNIARVGHSGSVSRAPVGDQPISPLAEDLSLSFVPGRPVGSIVISGVTDAFNGGVGGIGESDNDYHSYQLYDDLFVTRQANSLKFGVALERIQSDESASNSPNGRFVFGSLQAFLTNRPQSFNGTIPGASPTIQLRQTVFGAYVQDDFRVRSNLTLNLGLRYEMATVPTEKAGRLSNLADIRASQPRLGSPYFENPTLKNLSPRVGFAWDPFRRGKTAVRGGFGIYDTLPLTYQFTLLVVNTAPFYQTGAVTTLPQGSFPTGAFQALSANTLRYSSVQPDPKRSYVEQWHLNVQRELAANIVLHVGYVGQHGVHQPFRTNDANIVLPAQTEQGLVWPTPRASGARINPSVGVINTLAWLSSNTYHGLNVHLSRQGKGLRLGAAYTWSKSIDTSSSSIAGSNFNNSIVGPFLFFPEVMRGLSDFDVRHNVVLNALWEIGHQAEGTGITRLLGHGWQVGGIFRASSGLPFTVTIGGDPLGLRNANAFGFPDRLSRPECRNPVNPGNPDHYIRTECFAAPQPGTRLGNSRRNIAIGPGITNLDLSLFKNNYFGSESRRFNVQLRIEAFNVLNHPNFAVPDRTASQVYNQNLVPLTNAGRLTATSTTSRQIQLAIKLIR
jgi:hypothetical protein